ncbi:MAG: Holliday junction branch migration DNA helicase RuvB [Spirochaetia bacterium]|nr:Holliday junction branch migration DNA helicase RuvB [Spirochaetia bacterium]
MTENKLKLVLPEKQNGDIQIRPKYLKDFIGQKEVVQNLEIYLKAASLRNESLDHILFSGPPGLGKTTLARILANSQNGMFHQISAPNIKRPGDIAKILTTLQKYDILFIDEIHRLPAPVEEILYPAMEDGHIDITISEGMAASSITLDLPPFTLVGATTKPGAITAPLRDRFGIHLRLDYYEITDIEKIIKRSAKLWNIMINSKAIEKIAKRSRQTPRVALRLLRRVWDHAIVHNHMLSDKKEKLLEIDEENTIKSFEKMGIDNLGLTSLDISFLNIIAKNYKGGPVGLKPIASVLSEDLITLEDFIEPFLLKKGLLQKTARGRILTKEGFHHIGITNTSLFSHQNIQKELFSKDNSEN